MMRKNFAVLFILSHSKKQELYIETNIINNYKEKS